MADKVQLDVEVGGVEQSIKSVKDLKQAIKDAKDEQLKAAAAFGEGSKEFIEASKNVSKLKDKVEDLNDSTQSLKGSGVERASQGFNQLGEGLRNLDFDKVKVGLTAVKSALAATGIMLLVQGVTYLYENFDELSKGSGILAQALRFVGDVVTGLKDSILKLGDTVAGVNPELRGMAKELDNVKESMSGLLSEQSGRIERLIALAKANGESTVAYENLKQEAIIKTNKLYVDGIIAYVKAGGQLSEEQNKQLSASLDNIKNARTQQEVINITENKKELDRYKKLQEDKKKAEDDVWNKTVEIRIANNEAARQDDLRLAEEAKQAKIAANSSALAAINELELQDQQGRIALNQQEFDYKKANRDLELQESLSNYSKQADTASKVAQSLMVLTDAYFSYKRSKADKGSEQDLALAKKQFNFNKGLQLGLAAIDGFKSITSSLAQSPIAIGPIPNPAGIASLAFAIATTGASILKIASTKFDGGGSAPSTSAPAAPSFNAPTINTPSANTNSNTNFDEQGRNISTNNNNQTQSNQTITVRASIGVDEVSDKQQRVEVLEKRSTF